jgi:hypothetical protein
MNFIACYHCNTIIECNRIHYCELCDENHNIPLCVECWLDCCECIEFENKQEYDENNKILSENNEYNKGLQQTKKE